MAMNLLCHNFSYDLKAGMNVHVNDEKFEMSKGADDTAKRTTLLQTTGGIRNLDEGCVNST